MPFTNEFSLVFPIPASAANLIDAYILEGVKKALDERFELEHISLASTETGADDPTQSNAQGRHIPGKVSCLFYGTYSELIAITSPGTGAIGYATDTNNFYYYSAGWNVLALTSETIVPDDITLEITGTSGSGAGILGMKHDNQQWVTEFELTDDTNIETDCDNSNTFTVTLGDNRVLSNPTNMKAGATYIWRVSQDLVGSHTLSYGTAFKWPSGIAPILTTDGEAMDVILATSDGTSLFCSVLYDIK